MPLKCLSNQRDWHIVWIHLRSDRRNEANRASHSSRACGSWRSLYLRSVYTHSPPALKQADLAPISACDHSPLSSSIDTLASSLSQSSPNTKIIPYPLAPSNEQDTLTLIDDVLNAWGRLDVWVSSSGLLGPPSIDMTTPEDLQKCFEANSLAPFFALKYAPPAMGKLLESKGNYPNAAMKDQPYGSIVIVSSVASTYGGKWRWCGGGRSTRGNLW